jgi:hypothetical protein
MQAWKIVITRHQGRPELRAHEGHEWIYVLSGRVRLVLGEDDLCSSRARSSSSTRPFRTGSQHRRGTAEMLSIYGRPGERMRHHIRGS